MNTKLKLDISAMLMESYYWLGLKDVRKMDLRVREALDYFARDRERYIEVAEPDTPESGVTIRNGLICKLIPIARRTVRKREADCTRKETRVLSLLVAEGVLRYVYTSFFELRYEAPEQNSYSYPAHRFVELEDIQPKPRLLPPQKIRPVSTPREWQIFTAMFAAFDRLCRKEPIHYIPHKTERAMFAAGYFKPETVNVEGTAVTGKVIPLAEGEPLEQLQPDCRYSRRDRLCLLIKEENPWYLIRTDHRYDYFRKVILDDTPGGCIYEPTGEKREITYQFTTLEDIRKDMRPLYE